MIKATALKLVTAENRDLVADVLTKRSQNIKIEYSQNADAALQRDKTVSA